VAVLDPAYLPVEHPDLIVAVYVALALRGPFGV
jgi:hypothetical protein